MKNNKGFTLVEVLVTVTILGIITLVALPVINAISSKLNDNKLSAYKGVIESGAKIYTDSHDIDLFGYQKNGCVDVYYTKLVSDKVIEELDFTNQNVVVDKIFVRVKKVNDNYDYETYMPKEADLSSIDFNYCNGTINDSGPFITFSPDGNTKFEKKSYTNIQIKDILGISPNAKIQYQWFYTNGNPIGTIKTHDFKNSIAEILSLRVDTPTGLNGKIKLVVTPVDLIDEAGLSTTAPAQSKEFKLDNTAPDITVKIFKFDGAKSGNALLTKKNAEAKLDGWKNHGFYMDFNDSYDANGIKKEIWQWNEASNVNLVKNLSDSRKSTDNGIVNKTLTARGARYGKVTMCDEAENCRSADIIVYISPVYYIKYASNGGNTGSVGNTTCYYGYDCTLNNNGFGRTGYYFTKWNINGTEYNAGSNVKNLSSTDGQTLTANASWHGNTYYIAYNANGGGGNVGTTTCTYGNDCTLANNGFNRDGYSFTTWKINGTNYGQGSKVKNLATSGTVTAYAQWGVRNYTISYNANGGSGAPGNQTKSHGTNITLSGTKPTRGGWEFVGWNSSSTAHNSQYNPSSTYSANSNITLYAVWKKTVTVKFQRNKAGWGEDQKRTCTYYQNESQCSITAPNVPRPSGKNAYGQKYEELFSYKGWNTDKSATSSNFNQKASKNFSSDAKYYAVIKFTKKNVTVKAYVGDGVDYVNVRKDNDFSKWPDGAWGGKWKLTGDWWYGSGAGGYYYWIKGNVVSGSSTCYLNGNKKLKESKCNGWFTAGFARW